MNSYKIETKIETYVRGTATRDKRQPQLTEDFGVDPSTSHPGEKSHCTMKILGVPGMPTPNPEKTHDTIASYKS